MAVETIYRKFIILGLIFNSFIIYAQRIIYVNGTASTNGDGSEQSPYNRFKIALNSSQNGDTIKLLGNTSETDYIQHSNGEVEPFVIDKKVTIDGQGFTLLFRVSPLSLTQDIVFRNIRLELPPTTEKIVIDTKPVEGHNYIYANGNKITFDRVRTKIQGGHENTRPIIVAGTYKNTPDAGRAEIVFLNSFKDDGKIKGIIAGNTHTPKNTPTKIILDKRSRVDEIFFGGVDQPTNSKVHIISESEYIKFYNGNNSNNHLLELKGVITSSAIFNNIKNLSLLNSSRVNINSAIEGKLTIEQNSEAIFPERMILGELESNNGSITLPKNGKIIINKNALGNLNLDVNCDGSLCNFIDGEVLMEVNNSSNMVINFSSNPHQNQFVLEKVIENVKTIWRLKNTVTPQKDPVNNLAHTFNQNTSTLELTWRKPNNTKELTGYKIYKDGIEVHNITDINTLSYTEVINTSGNYEYKVIAIYNSGNSEPKTINANIEVATITPSPINSPSITFDKATKTLHIIWKKPNNLKGLTGYEIYEGSNKIHTIGNIEELSYSKTITTNGTYTYDIFAIYSDQKSDAKQVSINISTIPDNPTPTLPTNNTNIAIGKVGINTREPKVTLDIREIALDILPAGTPQGVNFPNLTTEQRETFDKTKIKEGTMIYNTSLKCLEFYDGSTWKCIQTKSN